MIIKQEEINTIQGDSFGQITETKINSAKLQKLYGILSGLYKDLFGSIVRELCSNMWDAHKQAGREDKPIMVILDWKEGNRTISFKDSGTGMNPDTMRNIFFNYLDSTKEDSDETIGGWGIGSKSPLAYTHTFYIDTIVDGVLYHYIFSKQANGIPAGELLFEESTEECNGTTITVPVKGGKGDMMLFMNAIKKQLIYFPNVYIENVNTDYEHSGTYPPAPFNNNYTIYTFKDFVYRPDLKGTDEMHMCIGNVYYPIDWVEIGIKPIYIPLALKFNIGELMPTPSREDIVYTKDSVKKIKDKIDATIGYINGRCASLSGDHDTINQYRIARDGNNKNYVDVELTDNVVVEIDKTYLSIDINPKISTTVSRIKNISKIFDTFIGIDYVVLNDAINLGSGYKVSGGFFSNHRKLANYEPEIPHNSIYFEYDNSRVNGINKNHYLLIEDTDNHKKNLFIAYKRNGSYSGTINLIKRNKPTLKLYKNTILSGIPKEDWREVIKEFQRIQKEYYESFLEKYEDIVIDEQWLKSEKERRDSFITDARIKRKIKSRIVYFKMVRGCNVPFASEKYENTVKEISNAACFIIYTTNDDKNRAAALQNILFKIESPSRGKYSKKKVFQVITTAVSNQKTFNEYPNMIEINEFLNSKHPLIVKIATAYAVKNILKGIDLYDNITDTDKLIVPELVESTCRFKKYINDYNEAYRRNRETDTLIELIYNLVNEANALDEGMIKDANLNYPNILSYSKIKKQFNVSASNRYYLQKNFDYYKYLTIVLRHEGIPYNRAMNCKNEFNEIYKICNPDEFKVVEQIDVKQIDNDD